ncbi:MAG: hypothetical protein ACK5Z2_20080 [Bacteroidota bacterium]|jgi:hypothetical protein
MKKKRRSGVGGKLTTKLLEGIAAKASRKAVQRVFEAGESVLFLRDGKLMKRNPDGSIEIIEEQVVVSEMKERLKKGDTFKLKRK